ncbi:Oidioi.mRNA.OKI2018_I69.chr1.g787.t1.cds [Oikopleura dioica]|uniref:Oidioi.mRNA.OKI2018_I69.chr1.g787.t1.cds n=1 Tax=Oikopleura dioica TaxID=34765 RepID=A0ABN7ST38_OIKDI|nr:Oidioi.mRNA.OKI2018_I69.chr1.g787.t1.cds [Oikopleura dioica]
MSFPRYPAPLSFIPAEEAAKLAKKTETDGFYYDQADGFYYDGFYYDGFARDNGFYYQNQQKQQVSQYQQGFYYNQEEKKWQDRQDSGDAGFAAEWQENENSKKALDAATKEATKIAETFAIKNKHAPNKTQGRILAQLAAERLAYEASEIFMNETAPDGDITSEDIRQKLFEMVVDALVN